MSTNNRCSWWGDDVTDAADDNDDANVEGTSCLKYYVLFFNVYAPDVCQRLLRHVTSYFVFSPDLMEQIYSRQGKISDLVDRIMDAEADKIRAQQAAVAAASKPASTTTTENTGSYPHDRIEPCADETVPASGKPQTESQLPAGGAATLNNRLLAKKKNRNALQRLVNAMRKKLRKNKSHPPHTSQKAV